MAQNQFQLNVNSLHIKSKIDATAEPSSPLHGKLEDTEICNSGVAERTYTEVDDD